MIAIHSAHNIVINEETGFAYPSEAAWEARPAGARCT